MVLSHPQLLVQNDRDTQHNVVIATAQQQIVTNSDLVFVIF